MAAGVVAETLPPTDVQPAQKTMSPAELLSVTLPAALILPADKVPVATLTSKGVPVPPTHPTMLLTLTSTAPVPPLRVTRGVAPPAEMFPPPPFMVIAPGLPAVLNTTLAPVDFNAAVAPSVTTSALPVRLLLILKSPEPACRTPVPLTLRIGELVVVVVAPLAVMPVAMVILLPAPVPLDKVSEPLVELVLALRAMSPAEPAVRVMSLSPTILELAVIVPLVPLVMLMVLPVEASPFVPPIVTEPLPAAAELLVRVTAPVPETELATKLPPVVTLRLRVVPADRLLAVRSPLPAVASTLPVAVIPSMVRLLMAVVAVKLPTLPLAVSVPEMELTVTVALPPFVFNIS